MSIAAAAAGAALIVLMLWESFTTIVLARRMMRRFNLTTAAIRLMWKAWKASARVFFPRRLRQTWLSVFAPLSVLTVLSAWACGLIVGFALLHWAAGSAVRGADEAGGFLTDLYFSGSTFFTLGLGDFTPRSSPARLLAVVEAGMGFAFLAMVLSYLPPLNQNFVRRETTVTLLDSRAGSPPTAAEMLRRHGDQHGLDALRRLLQDWEVWAAELLEGHLTFPILAYFRSQHDNQSWLGGLTAVLDTCALIMAGLEGACERQAELTFAIARHAVVDLSLVFKLNPRKAGRDRLPPAALAELRASLAAAGLKLRTDDDADRKLSELRLMYEPFVHVLAEHLQMGLPPWDADGKRSDNWQVSGWAQWDFRRRSFLDRHPGGDHFESR